MPEFISSQEIDDKSGLLSELSRRIWEHPETAFQEVKASQWTAELLEQQGFLVERNYAGLSTALRATWGHGEPFIGLLGEYDALPGMSQKVAVTEEPLAAGSAGQACGHNLLGVAHVAAALGLKKEMEEKGLPGTVVFYGCPGEELVTGKGFMARGGAFRELSMSMAFHPGTHNAAFRGRSMALNSARFHFKGRTAHAGNDPYNGRSALDGVEVMNIGTNYLREHVTPDVRLHYVITDGGEAPNIVPDKASVWYYVRALDRHTVDETYARLKDVAKGAALINGVTVVEEFLGGCYNTMNNHVLVDLIHESMHEVDLPVYTAEELAFAAALNEASPKYQSLLAKGSVEPGVEMHAGISPISDSDGYSSTDVGDVQHIAPGVMFTAATQNLGAPGHSWQLTACAGSSLGEKGMLYAGKVMARAGIKALEDPATLKKARAEFDKAMAGRPYECPIPEDLPLPGQP